MPDLFGREDAETPAKPKRSKALAKAPAVGYTEAVALYFELFERQFGVKPRFRARDGKHMKDLVAEYGGPVTLDLIRLMFTSTSPRIAGSDYSVPVLYANAQFLRIGQNGKPVPDRRTAENLDAARRAMGRRRE